MDNELSITDDIAEFNRVTWKQFLSETAGDYAQLQASKNGIAVALKI